MKLISTVILVTFISFLSCTGQKTESEVKKEVKDTVKQETPLQKTELIKEIDDLSSIVGTWAIVSIDGKDVPEERREVTVTFYKDGKVSRRQSSKHDPQDGEYFFEDYEGKKYLNFVYLGNKEMNELVRLTDLELAFLSMNKVVLLRKTGN